MKMSESSGNVRIRNALRAPGEDGPDRDSGAYQLIIRLAAGESIHVGALGEFHFNAGLYVYTGRAARNLRSRIERHARKKKKLRWHVDYLLRLGRIEVVQVYPERAQYERLINRMTAESYRVAIPAPGFGASDCSCSTHLFRIQDDIDPNDFQLDAWRPGV